MKNFITKISIILLPVLFFSCSNPSEVDPLSLPVMNAPIITGIRITFEGPEQVGQWGNPTDISSINISPAPSGHTFIPPYLFIKNPYPNPALKRMTIGFNIPSDCFATLWMLKGTPPSNNFFDPPFTSGVSSGYRNYQKPIILWQKQFPAGTYQYFLNTDEIPNFQSGFYRVFLTLPNINNYVYKDIYICNDISEMPKFSN